MEKKMQTDKIIHQLQLKKAEELHIIIRNKNIKKYVDKYTSTSM